MTKLKGSSDVIIITEMTEKLQETYIYIILLNSHTKQILREWYGPSVPPFSVIITTSG